MQGDTSDAMKAFLEQANIDDEQADENEAVLEEYKKQNYNKALLQIATPNKSITEVMGLPTKLKDGELDQKTEPHKNFKDYDHSLDQTRDWSSDE